MVAQAARASSTSCARSATRSGPRSSTGGSRPPAQEAGRALRDRVDLFRDGGDTIRLGRHRFAVNTQPLELTLVPHDGGPGASPHRHRLPRRRYATRRSPRRDRSGTSRWSPSRPRSTAPSTWRRRSSPPARWTRCTRRRPTEPWRELVRRIAEARYDEGYERGVHDARRARDPRRAAAAARRGRPAALPAGGARGGAAVLGVRRAEPPREASWTRRAASLARARAAFGSSPALDDLRGELAAAIDAFAATTGLPTDAARAASTSFEELAVAPAGFVTGAGARTLVSAFRKALGGPRSKAVREFEDDLRALGDDLAARHQLVRAWLTAYLRARRRGRRRPRRGGRDRAVRPGGHPSRVARPTLTRHRRGPARHPPAHRRAAR